MRGLKQIKAPVKDSLTEFETHFKRSMRSDVPLLDRISHFIVKRKGKQLRPILVFLCADAAGNINISTHHAASLVELLHTATLVHDDVVDGAQRRRGFFSINALWKNKIAVLVGDYLLSRGLLLALKNEEYDLLQIVSHAVEQMSEGELLQIEKSRRLDIDEEVYFEIIRKKTASLIGSACKAGAASTTENTEIIEAIYKFGVYLGITFQIKDDLFDYGEKKIGKPVGIDIKEKKMTLPLIYALSHTTRKEKKHIKNIMHRSSEKKKVVREVIDFVKRSDGLNYTEEKMLVYKKKAMEQLNYLPPSPSLESLKLVVNYVVERNH